MDFEYLHLFVHNAAVWRDWFVKTLDFAAIAAPTWQAFGELAVQRDRILILLSSPGSGRREVSHFLHHYAEGVGDVALRVRDLDAIAARLQRLGVPLTAPISTEVTAAGPLRWCRISGWGSLTHTLIERPADPPRSPVWTPPRPIALPWLAIDHAVLNVPEGELLAAATWYEKCLGFQPEQQFVIQTPRSGLRSLVLKHPDGDATLPINEPTSDNSQVQEFITQHRGAGIQHAALKTADLVTTIAELRRRQVQFLSVPASYYQQLPNRAGFWRAAGDWAAIAQQQILVDWPADSPQSRLLQTFTQPLFERPTFFWEFIERQSAPTPTGQRPADGFGEGNFQALFEAIEREQQSRGSLG
ncbi:4-hydroxyphenylpyruvate dioxygenase family protein [Leptolyngbya iicbica]|uniref:4-hydroxyphenylpyruvate dioxygenase n=2 Tax=Cyanophyceae TaxID=3028117 RepID=A0A4V2E1X5_9CYAN|nr:VOC family protein [Leptolyngbya sp. LK]RZM75654.1 4-hydroxyphenylpyruvate dioxygenase [Leptolyngbya sp. LK]